jgi:hypothetical protein
MEISNLTQRGPADTEEMVINPREDALIRRMAQESTEMWLACANRDQMEQEVVICQSPSRAFYLSRVGNTEGNIYGWAVRLQPLKMDHAREFFAAFGSHYYYWIGATMQGDHVVRAYIKNGRKKDWTISIGASE